MRRIFKKNLRKLLKKSFVNVLPDKLCCSLQYFVKNEYFPDYNNPITFNEKIAWYKTHYRDPLMTKVADKYEVRKFVSERGFAYILNDLYAVFESENDLVVDSFPEKFVLKATHGWNMNIICEDKSSFDIEGTKKKMKKWLKENWYWKGKQWAYKNIKPRIIAEKYLVNTEYGELIDYKFYCYNGKPEVLFVCAGRFSDEGVKYDAFDMQWNKIPVYKGKPSTNLNFPMPPSFEEMKNIASVLSRGFPFVRVDLYLVDGKILFGELTFYPDNGTANFTPPEYNVFFGNFFVTH